MMMIVVMGVVVVAADVALARYCVSDSVCGAGHVLRSCCCVLASIALMRWGEDGTAISRAPP
jgi:hypothetical protein